MEWVISLLQRWRGRERLLFGYWDGIKTRSADPLVAWRKLWNTPGTCDFAADCQRANNPKRQDGESFYSAEEVFGAEDRLRKLTREIFGVAEWSETTPGLTLDETDELLNRFMVFIEELKKKRSHSRTSSAPSTSTEPCGSEGGDDCPVGAPSDSNSCPTASNDAAPTGS